MTMTMSPPENRAAALPLSLPLPAVSGLGSPAQHHRHVGPAASGPDPSLPMSMPSPMSMSRPTPMSVDPIKVRTFSATSSIPSPSLHLRNYHYHHNHHNHHQQQPEHHPQHRQQQQHQFQFQSPLHPPLSPLFSSSTNAGASSLPPVLSPSAGSRPRSPSGPPLHLPVPVSGPISAVANQDGKSRILQGPSAKDWAQHRETIIDLYRQYPLKKVSEIMRKHHNFSASKRMYDKRFREWNVFKNVNSDEKERLVRRGTEPASPTNSIDRDSISSEDLRRTLRCAKTIQQGGRRTSPPIPCSPGSDQGGPSYQHAYQHRDRRQHRPDSRGVSISDLVQKTLPQPPITVKSPPDSERGQSPPTSSSSPELICATPTSSSAWSDEHLSVPSGSSDGSNARSLSSSPAPCLSVFKARLQKLAETLPPTINSESKTRSLEIITMSIRDFYDWQLQTIPEGILPDDYFGQRCSDESMQYWSTVKNAIYLIKISAGSMGDVNNRPDSRAWPALAEAGGIAAAAMDSQPFDFLRNVFATLSPANTSARPELRSILLQFLATEARNRHSPQHPIARICDELQRDEDCQEVSRRALQCMLDTFNSRLGKSRAVTFKILDSLATLLRRNGEFEAAMEIVQELLTSCREVFGKDSDQARTVENELAHFYMVADEHDRALEHCMSVVKRPQAPESPESPSDTESVFYQDGIAAHTMEDIAEIHQRRGDVEQCITWLKRAASIALNVWGPKSLATSHIVDKMTSLQRQFGKDLLRSAMVWEAAIV